MRKHRRQCGFTLVELLVVIGIVTVLVSVLLPAIATARHKAKGVQCQANLRTLHQAFTAYCQDNNGRSFAYVTTAQGFWANLLLPFGCTPASLTCPEAYDTNGTGVGAANVAWGGLNNPYASRIGSNPGSYGFNGWLYEAAPPAPAQQLPSPANTAYWHLPPSADASQIPIFADSVWVEGWPLGKDQAPGGGTPPGNLVGPGSPIAGSPSGTSNYMQEFCIDRHPHRRVNVEFLDGHSDSFALEELWSAVGATTILNWYPGYLDTVNRPASAPTVP
jgi:prepilin-type N-terminal cleavage/methylation domain-containing protein